MALMLVLPACASTGQAGHDVAIPVQHAVTLQVQNESWHNVVVFVEGADGMIRVGRVAAQADERFRVPASTVKQSSVRLIARTGVAALHSDLRTEPLTLNSGETVRWVLQGRPGVSNEPRSAALRVYAGQPAASY